MEAKRTLAKLDKFDNWTIHGPAMCVGQPCPFHSPSQHPMTQFKKHLRDDKHFLVERICPHGVGHPDPDSLWFFKSRGLDLSMHGCDGCCGVKKNVKTKTKSKR